MIALLRRVVDYVVGPNEPVVPPDSDVDYSALSREEIEYVDPKCEDLFKNSRIVSEKGKL